MNLAVTERSVRLLVGEPASPFAVRLVSMLRLLSALAAIFIGVGLLGAEPKAFVVGLVLIVPAALWHGLSEARGT